MMGTLPGMTDRGDEEDNNTSTGRTVVRPSTAFYRKPFTAMRVNRGLPLSIGPLGSRTTCL